MTKQSGNMAAKPLDVTNLDEARKEIDAVDDQIHALLMRRAQIVQFVGSTKRGGGGAYRPAREAMILKRLLDQNHPPLDFKIVYRLWREMIGGFTAMQAPLRVSVTAGLERLARDHFGAAAIVTTHADKAELAEAMRADPSLLAIVSKENLHLCVGEGTPNVVAALPIYGTSVDAYCLASAEPQDSGGDITLFVDTANPDKLIALSGFLIHDEAARDEVTELGAAREAVQCIGAYPVCIIETTP